MNILVTENTILNERLTNKNETIRSLIEQNAELQNQNRKLQKKLQQIYLITAGEKPWNITK